LRRKKASWQDGDCTCLLLAGLCETSRMTALVLLHGVGRSGESQWREVVPLLADHHQVYAPTALGHRGGPPVQRHPATMTDVVDAAEHYLDERELDRPHLAGISLGALIAIELARRGRAATVCALNPPGLWSPGDGLQARAFKPLRMSQALGRLLRPVLPLMYRSAALRRLAFRDAAVHGDQLTQAQTVELANDALACTVLNDLAADVWHIAPLDPLPCPITVAWSEKDRLLPMAEYASAVPQRLPHATFKVLAGVGHDPTIDDARLVARTILGVTGAAKD
jgi:pimeloyl-ACP methyl ester carboxylesterase